MRKRERERGVREKYLETPAVVEMFTLPGIGLLTCTDLGERASPRLRELAYCGRRQDPLNVDDISAFQG